MRKKLGMVIICGLLVSSLAGCSASSSDNKPGNTSANTEASSSAEDTTAEDKDTTEEAENTEDNSSENTSAEDNSSEDTDAADNSSEDTSAEDSNENTEGNNEGNTDDITVGQALLNSFKTQTADNADISAQDLADALCAVEAAADYGLVTMPVEEGYLNGFDEEVKGFKEGIMFSPMIGSIPFVGYIFTLEDGADVDSFKNTLKEQSNTNWNICTTADETFIENAGNTVFFLMSPANLEEF